MKTSLQKEYVSFQKNTAMKKLKNIFRKSFKEINLKLSIKIVERDLILYGMIAFKWVIGMHLIAIVRED